MTNNTHKNTRKRSQSKTRRTSQMLTYKQYKDSESNKRANPLELLKNDYYTYVNLTWLKKTKLPSKYNIIDEFSTLQRKVNKEIENKIGPILLKDKNIHNLYSSIYTFNNEFVNSQFYLLMNVLNDHRKNRDKNSLSIFLAWLINNDFNSPVNFYITNDLKNNKNKIAYITDSGTTFPKDFYVNSASSNDREKYKSYLKNLFAIFLR